MTLRDFQQDFNKNFTKIASVLGDLAAQVAQDITSPTAQRLIKSAAQLIRPFYLNLGLRIVKLNQEKIEILVPAKDSQVDENGDILESVLVAAGTQAFSLLWKANWPASDLKIRLQSLQLNRLQAALSESSAGGDLRLRYEITELQRESALAELRNTNLSEQNAQLVFYNQQDQICAEILIRGILTQESSQKIEWKK